MHSNLNLLIWMWFPVKGTSVGSALSFALE